MRLGSPTPTNVMLLPAKNSSPSLIVREVSFGTSVLNLIVTGADVPTTAPVPSRTSATMRFSSGLSSPISAEKAPSLSVCVVFTFVPLSLILTELVGFEVPLTRRVFVETVVFVVGSLMTMSAFVCTGSPFGTAVTSTTFSIPPFGPSSSKITSSYLPAFLSVKPSWNVCFPWSLRVN